MKKFLSVLSLLILLFFSSCRKRAKKVNLSELESPIATSIDIPFPIEKETVVMQVEGVECPLCAQLVVDKVQAIDGISNAGYFVHNDDYEKGYVQFKWQKESSIPVKELMTTIEAQGFTILQLTGPFVGKFLFNYQQQQIFSFDDSDLSFPISLSKQASIPIDNQNWAMLLEKGTIDIVATLKLTEDGQAFVFVPKRLYEAVEKT